MADSLLFDGTDDRIRFSIGSAGVVPPATVAAIVKTGSDAAAQCILSAGPAASASQYLLQIFGGGEISLTRPGVADSGCGLDINVADGWVLVAGCKATGTVAPTYHRFEYGVGWSHATGVTSYADWSAPTGQAAFSDFGDGQFTWNGSILIGGVWDQVFSDAEFEALGLEDGMQAWIDAAPNEGWRLNSMSTIDSFVGGTSSETSRLGTSLDTGDVPAGWTDIGGDVTVISPVSITTAVAPVPGVFQAPFADVTVR